MFHVQFQMRSKLRGYFSRYGTVESVRLFAKGSSYSAFILFKTTKGAQAALSVKKHRINKHIVKVNEARQCHQPGFKRTVTQIKTPSTPDQSCSPILRILNDECLKKVFECLHLRDLSNVAKVSKRFKYNAEAVFSSKYANLDILDLIEGDANYILFREWYKIRWLNEQFFDLVEQLFRNFGPLIKALKLTGSGKSDENDAFDDAFDEILWSGLDESRLLALVKSQCTSLKELTLYDMGYDKTVSIELRPLFASLEKLNLNHQGDVCDNFIELFSDCRELKWLKVDGGQANIWINHKFPKLEALEISDFWDFWDYEDLDKFFESHPNLRTYKFKFNCLSTINIEYVSKRLQKLETLYFNVNEYDDIDYYEEDEWQESLTDSNILQLTKLKSLKNLTFKCEARSMKLLVDAFSKENTPIEHFEILDGTIDNDLVLGLSQMKSMKTLKLTGCEMSEGTPINLAEHLNGLDKLVIKDIKGVDLSVVEEKLSFVENVCVEKTPKKLVRKLPDQNSSDMLNTLDDDCLKQVFKHLPLPDLCNVADVCRRFRQNAKDLFKSKHTNFNTNEMIKSSSMREKIDMNTAEKLFRNFGSTIESLSLDGWKLGNERDKDTIFYLATKYCKSLSILSLDSIRMNIPARWLLTYLRLFVGKLKLEMNNCQLDESFGRFLAMCGIQSYQVSIILDSASWMKNTFFNLQALVLSGAILPDKTFNEFVKLNVNLSILMLIDTNFSTKIFKTIADHLPKLERFYFDNEDTQIGKHVLHLAKLKSLKVLALNCKFFSMKPLVDEFAKENVPIEELELKYGTIDMELLGKLSALKSMKRLQLECVKMVGSSLIDLVTHLPMLSHLEIDLEGVGVHDLLKMLPFARNLEMLKFGSSLSNVQIDVGEYQSILRIVKNRANATSLCIIITSEKPHVSVPQYMLQENRYWLRIENGIAENIKYDKKTDSSTEPDGSISDDSDSSYEDFDESNADP